MEFSLIHQVKVPVRPVLGSLSQEKFDELMGMLNGGSR